MNYQKNQSGFFTKKHWFYYIPSLLVGILGLFLMVAMYFLWYFGFGIILCAILNVYMLRSVEWELDDAGIYARSGILPWARTQIFIPYSHVYETYISYSMFGHYLNFGSITIQKTDGVASQVTWRGLVNVKEFATLINQRLQQRY